VHRKRTNEMSTGWKKTGARVLSSARDLALLVLAFGGVQFLRSVVVWAVLFRSRPQGFSMALTLVGFAGWFIAFTSSFASRRKVPWTEGTSRQPPGRVPPAGTTPPPESTPPAGSAARPPASPLVETAQAQVGRFGCGTVLFLSSLIPLGLAFILRVQADMQSGKTWSDIFPDIP
jgi:hypothetical protein